MPTEEQKRAFAPIDPKTTPVVGLDSPERMKDAFAGNDNNRLAIGRAIVGRSEAEGISLSDAAENGSGKDSFVHQSNLDAANRFLATRGVLRAPAASNLTNSVEEQIATTAPVVDPAIVPNQIKVAPTTGATSGANNGGGTATTAATPATTDTTQTAATATTGANGAQTAWQPGK